jgi:hypothetical protein
MGIEGALFGWVGRVKLPKLSQEFLHFGRSLLLLFKALHKFSPGADHTAVNFAQTILILVAPFATLPLHASSELVASPNRQYSVRVEFADDPEAPFRYRAASFIDQRTGQVIQTLTMEDLSFDEISVQWSPDSTLVAVYCAHKRDGWTDVYRVRDSKPQKLDMPKFDLPAKEDLKKQSYPRFDYRKPTKWASGDTLRLNCTGKVQLRAIGKPGFQFLPEWVTYSYQVEIQFKRDDRAHVKSIERRSLEYHFEGAEQQP